MCTINISSFHRTNTKINVVENITIKELKEIYAEQIGAGLDANYLEFTLVRRMLNNDTTLNDLLEGELGELNITSIEMAVLRSDCIREINSLDFIPKERKKLDKLKTILRKKIIAEGENPILASSDSHIVLAALQQNGAALQYASDELRAKRAIVLAAVQENGWALQYALEDLKADREIVFAAVQQNGSALQYASEDLKKDRAVVLAAVQENGLALQYAPELKADSEIVLEAIKQYGWVFQYASPELKADFRFVLTVVQENGFALEYASLELKADRAIVLAAVKRDGFALQYA
jgi:hypothetical protein